jgi:hypothetical protein
MSGENIEELFIMASKILYNNFKDKIAQLVSKICNYSNHYLFIERRSHQKEINQKT